MSTLMYVAGTTPYPWPYNGRLEAASTALLVITPSGSAPVTEPVRVLIDSLSRSMRRRGGVVLSIQTAPHLSRRAAPVRGANAGAPSSAPLSEPSPEFTSEMSSKLASEFALEFASGSDALAGTGNSSERPRAGESPIADVVISAGGHDGFCSERLDKGLRSLGVTNLLLCGSGLETAIHSTMRSANDRGYECLVISDACEPADPRLHHQALSMIEMSGGIFGAVGHSDAVITALDSFTTRAGDHRAARV